MSDVHVDKLNNSQLILLVLLISLVVSAATAVATLSVVYERLAQVAGEETESQPTIIRQTINRIIERDPALVSSDSAVDTRQKQGAALTLETIEQSMVRLYFGSQPFAQGVYVSPKGHILASEVLDGQRRYSVLDEVGQPTFLSLAYSGEQYSLLAPVDVGTHNVEYYVPLRHSADVSLGQSVVVFGGLGQNAQLYTGIVSQKRTTADAVGLVRTSIPVTDIVNIAAVFVEDSFVGFTQPYSDWIPLLDSNFITDATEAIQAQSTGGNTSTEDTELSQ